MRTTHHQPSHGRSGPRKDASGGNNNNKDLDVVKLKVTELESDIRFFSEAELQYVSSMMESRASDFKKSEMVRPFHSKAICTIRRVLESMGMENEF